MFSLVCNEYVCVLISRNINQEKCSIVFNDLRKLFVMMVFIMVEVLWSRKQRKKMGNIFFGSGQAVLKTTVRGISSRTHHHLNGKEFGNNSTLYY